MFDIVTARFSDRSFLYCRSESCYVNKTGFEFRICAETTKIKEESHGQEYFERGVEGCFG